MKKSRILIGTLALSCLLTFTSYAGEWKQDAKGWWYQNDNGSYKVNEWFTDPVDGGTYHFDTFGYINTGKSYIDGKWYYFLESGALGGNGVLESGEIVTDSGEIVYPDTPGIIAFITVQAMEDPEMQSVISLGVKNLRNKPLTIDGECRLNGKNYSIDMYAFDSNDNYLSQITVAPNETKIINYFTLDLHPVNITFGETEAKFSMQCGEADYWVYGLVYGKDSVQYGYITYCKP